MRSLARRHGVLLVPLSIDRETIATASWQTAFASSSSTSYQDPQASYAQGGYRYRVSAITAGVHSPPGNVVPQPRYALISIGTGTAVTQTEEELENDCPPVLNNQGTVVYLTDDGQGQARPVRWKNGVLTPLLLPANYTYWDTLDMDDNDNVIASAALLNSPTYSYNYAGLLWAAPSTSATILPTPDLTSYGMLLSHTRNGARVFICISRKRAFSSRTSYA